MIIAHLLESTLLLALAILIAHIPRLAARTRYAIVFAALMKFAIPSAIVPRILAALGIDLAGMTGTIVITALGPLTATPLPQRSAAIWPIAAAGVWAAIAIALLARSFVRGRAAQRRALANAIEADEGNLTALAHARQRAGVKKAIRLVRSPSVATPATVGLLRSIIVIPTRTNLAGAELETILTHECAHVARRDNLLSVIESIAGGALWFHPLVWIARRVLDAAREEACDAVVISSGHSETYINALGKVCGAAIAPRAAGISCIVSNTIQERMNAIMRFGTRRLLPHRAITAAVIALMAIVTFGTGVAKALPRPAAATDTASRYEVRASMTRDVASNFVFNVTVRNRETGEVTTSHFQSPPDETYTKKWDSVDKNGVEQETFIRAIGRGDGTATVNIDIKGEPPVVIRIVPKKASAKSSSDDPISLNLKDAEIHDVLRTFAQLTKMNIAIAPGVTGVVTEDLYEIPWTEALDKLLDDANLQQKRVGNTIYIHRK
ncbi:MAG TPA: M56 family metallopeptidase [Thermoanaerobaculia bacterium]|jgi:beta-lactamase regulating signal transducer with metallopeptidase domain|nr:M56 family metallopeptidase [Thermoanaerobaculia bacterium]